MQNIRDYHKGSSRYACHFPPDSAFAPWPSHRTRIPLYEAAPPAVLSWSGLGCALSPPPSRGHRRLGHQKQLRFREFQLAICHTIPAACGGRRSGGGGRSRAAIPVCGWLLGEEDCRVKHKVGTHNEHNANAEVKQHHSYLPTQKYRKSRTGGNKGRCAFVC